VGDGRDDGDAEGEGEKQRSGLHITSLDG
jgi:hypothetical protein